MSEYLDKIGEGASDIREVLYALLELSDAFYVTGNYPAGEKLEALAKVLKGAESKINGAVRKEINDRFHDSVRMARETAAACLTESIDRSKP